MPAEGVVNAAMLSTVLGIWREVLECPDGWLNQDSNFFLNGGDSLQMTRVLIRIRERLGVNLELRDVARFSTPRKMTESCAAVAPRQSVALVRTQHDRVCRNSDPEKFQASAGQAGLWLAEQLSGASGLYNTAVVLHLSGDVQVHALARALTLLLRQHEVLRSRLYFDVQAQQLVCAIDPLEEVALEAVAVAAHAAPKLLHALAALPFDLIHGPVVRFHLLATGYRTWSLLLCLHHCVSDGWSGSVLLQHLAATYKALLKNPHWQATGVDYGFRDFCLKQVAPVATELDWWREQLAGADQLAPWPVTAEQRWPFALAYAECQLPEHSLALVLDAVQHTQVDLSAFLLTALRLTLRSLTGIDELCIGLPVNVRTTSAQERSIGYFVNLLVTRDCLAPEMAELDALRKVQSGLRDVLSHRETPLPLLARALNPALLPSGNPWCDILFAFQNLPQAKPDFAGLDVDVEALTMPYGQHPLKVEIVRSVGGWSCRIEYARELLTRVEIQKLLALFQEQIIQLAQNRVFNSR